MNIERISSLVSTIANVGVLVGLVVVLYELNQNNISLRNDVAWSHATTISEMTNSSAIDAELAEFVLEAFNWEEGEFYEKVGTTDHLRFTWYMTSRVNYLQGRFLTETNQSGRESLRAAFQLYIGCPSAIEYWRGGLTQRILDSEFVEFGNEVISQIEQNTELRPRFCR